MFTYITLHVHLQILHSCTVKSCFSRECIMRNTRYIISLFWFWTWRLKWLFWLLMWLCEVGQTIFMWMYNLYSFAGWGRSWARYSSWSPQELIRRFWWEVFKTRNLLRLHLLVINNWWIWSIWRYMVVIR